MMRNFRLALLVGLFLLLAGPALAQTWSKSADGTGECGSTLSAGERCSYHIPAASTTDSNILGVTAEYMTCWFNPDTTSGSPGVATAQVKLMPVSTSAAAGNTAGGGDANPPVLNLTFTGATGSEVIYEIPSGRYYVDVTVAPGAGEEAAFTCEGARK